MEKLARVGREGVVALMTMEDFEAEWDAAMRKGSGASAPLNSPRSKMTIRHLLGSLLEASQGKPANRVYLRILNLP